MVEAARWSILSYGVLMIVGGILGYVLPKTPSKVSLIAGCASGVLAVLAYFVALDSNPLPGLAIGLVVAGGVGAMMFLRWKQTKKFMPSGMIVLLSGVVVVLAVIALAGLG